MICLGHIRLLLCTLRYPQSHWLIPGEPRATTPPNPIQILTHITKPRPAIKIPHKRILLTDSVVEARSVQHPLIVRHRQPILLHTTGRMRHLLLISKVIPNCLHSSKLELQLSKIRTKVIGPSKTTYLKQTLRLLQYHRLRRLLSRRLQSRLQNIILVVMSRCLPSSHTISRGRVAFMLPHYHHRSKYTASRHSNSHMESHRAMQPHKPTFGNSLVSSHNLCRVSSHQTKHILPTFHTLEMLFPQHPNISRNRKLSKRA